MGSRVQSAAGYSAGLTSLLDWWCLAVSCTLIRWIGFSFSLPYLCKAWAAHGVELLGAACCLWASIPRGGAVERGQVQMSPGVVPPAGLQPTGVDLGFTALVAIEGGKFLCYTRALALGVAFLNPNQKSSKALNPKVLLLLDSGARVSPRPPSEPPVLMQSRAAAVWRCEQLGLGLILPAVVPDRESSDIQLPLGDKNGITGHLRARLQQ